MIVSKNKTIFLQIFTLITLIGCAPESSPDNQYESIYKESFKLTYFRQLLDKSYNRSYAIQEIIKADHSGFTEPILTEEDYGLIDSLTKKDNLYLKMDSAAGDRRAEGAQGKRPLQFIIAKLSSKTIDSIAEKRWIAQKDKILNYMH